MKPLTFKPLRVKIKKSANVLAWSNNNIGKIITVYPNQEGYTGGYQVFFNENQHLEINKNWIAGIIYFNDCEVITEINN